MTTLLLLAALTGHDLDDLRLILLCGSAEVAPRVCCRAAEEMRRTANADAREVLEGYLRRNCWGPGRPRVSF